LSEVKKRPCGPGDVKQTNRRRRLTRGRVLNGCTRMMRTSLPAASAAAEASAWHVERRAQRPVRRADDCCWQRSARAQECEHHAQPSRSERSCRVTSQVSAKIHCAWLFPTYNRFTYNTATASQLLFEALTRIRHMFPGVRCSLSEEVGVSVQIERLTNICYNLA